MVPTMGGGQKFIGYRMLLKYVIEICNAHLAQGRRILAMAANLPIVSSSHALGNTCVAFGEEPNVGTKE